MPFPGVYKLPVVSKKKGSTSIYAALAMLSNNLQVKLNVWYNVGGESQV